MANRPIEYVAKGGALWPNSKADREAFEERYGEGELVAPISEPLQRKLWMIVNKIIKNGAALLPPESDYDAESFMDALKRDVGFTAVGETLSGKPYMFARSLSEVTDWPEFYKKCVKTLEGRFDIDIETLLGPAPKPQQEGPEASPSPPEKEASGHPSQTPVAAMEYSAQACIDKMLALATDWKAWEGREEDHIRHIDHSRLAWMKHIRDLGFVYKVAEEAIRVARRKRTLEDARRLLEAQKPEGDMSRYKPQETVADFAKRIEEEAGK